MTRSRLAGLLVLLLAVAGAPGCLSFAQPRGPTAPLLSCPGSWTDEMRTPVTLEAFRGAPFVLSAFFTSCNVRCPMTIQKLKGIDLAYRKSGAAVPIVLFTIDPRNDTPERLQRFRRDNDLPDNWHFLRGSDSDTRILARSLRVDPAYDDGHIDHDVRIAVFDAAGHQVRAFQGWAFDVEGAIVR